MRQLCLFILVLICAGCGSHIPPGYAPREGDVVFQSFPHNPLIDAIEGATHSPYSHCGIVTQHGQDWFVLEAVGPVKETSLSDWIERGREEKVAAYRLLPRYTEKIPVWLTEARKFTGRPYDIHYDMDDKSIYCSELVYKAFKAATGEEMGSLQRLGDLNWQPYQQVIERIENGSVPLDRQMITPRSLAGAEQLERVFTNGLEADAPATKQ